VQLKHARERLGLSAAQIEERTKVQLPKIEALEDGNIAVLPGGIYLDGIIRAYAHEVGLDPEPLIQQARYERATVTDDWEASFGDLDTLFRKEEATESRTPAKIDGAGESLRPGWVEASASLREDTARTEDAGFESYYTGLRGTRGAEIELAESSDGRQPFSPTRRRSRVVIAMVALLAVLGWGAYFFEASRQSATVETPVVSLPSSAPSSVPKDNQAAATSNLPTPPGDQQRRLDANAGAVEKEAGTAGTAAPSAQSPPDVAPTPPIAEPRTEPSSAATLAAAGPASTVAPAGDISGDWRLSTRVQSSNTPDFIGLSLGFDVQLAQAGNRVTGSGRKVIENGEAIAAPAQTAISLAGTIAGDRLTLTFTEQGAQRPTQGKFVLLLEDAGTLRGRFTSTAAQSSGTVEAHRAKQP
jgi:cytoskeletal protein RodZ